MSRPWPESLALDLPLDAVDDDQGLRRAVAKHLAVEAESLPALYLLKRSIDARGGRVRVHAQVGFSAPPAPATQRLPREVQGERQVLIVGDGPAGLFCAYELARRGIRCVVLDRGKPVQPRRRDLRNLHQEGLVDPDSNYGFGEGGAGTYSDGKLYTRAVKRGDVADVLGILMLHGAPAAIGIDARPHIGSNRLPKVITAMRERLEGVGVRFRFGAHVTDLQLSSDRRVTGVELADGERLAADAVVLATGHSARDVLGLLQRHGAALQAKAFAVGVRIEHPQPLIDHIQYGRNAGHAKLGSAAYRLVAHGSPSVFSFCMCPGGWVVPASTAAGEVVVNGMSLAKRNSPFANSGLVVAVDPTTLAAHGFHGALGGIGLQRRLEQAAFAAGGGALRAPATRATDFIAQRASSTTPRSSYIPGLQAGDLRELLDGTGLPLSDALRQALQQFDRKMRGYLSEEAVLIGVETRTSSPVRVPRHPETLQSTELAGLYPCGEGAGYAGGIVSAALDGMRVAVQISRSTAPPGR